MTSEPAEREPSLVSSENDDSAAPGVASQRTAGSDAPGVDGSGPSPRAGGPWFGLRQYAFRFVLIYGALYIFPFPLGYVPGLADVAGWVSDRHWQLVHRVSVQLLALPDTRPPVGGCGDRADHYVAVLVDSALALAATGAWGWLDRRRATHYPRLRYWATVGVRYYLAYTLLEYGAIKLFKSQFQLPRPSVLVGSVGELTPMQLLWTLMGISSGYCAFIGASEALAGFLLFFRSTTLLGALLAMAVLSNVFLLNVFYGVCVKLFSAHLLWMATLLVVPRVRGLLAALLGRAVPAEDLAAPRMSARWGRARWLAKLAVVPALVLVTLKYGYDAWYAYGDAAPKPAFYGLWDVERFTRNGVPPSPGDATAWQWLAVESGPFATLQCQAGKPRAVGLSVDAAAHRVLVQPDPNVDARVSLPFSRPAADVLELEGPLDGATTFIRLKLRSPARFRLTRGSFRWTSDLP